MYRFLYDCFAGSSSLQFSNVFFVPEFTLKVRSHLTFAFASTLPSKFNIASMETQTQTHRMGLNPFLTFYIEVMLNVDADANANVKHQHTLIKN